MIKISVITPSRNIDQNVINSIDTVSSQKCNYELEHLIIIDSDDHINNITKPICNNYKLKILKNYSNNKGPSIARNIGINKSNGDYIFFLDADDLWNENYIDEVMKIYINNSNIDAVSCSGRILDNGKFKKTLTQPYIKDGLLTKNQILWNSIGCPSGFSFKKIIGQKRIFAEELNLCEDYLFYIGFVESNSKIYRSNKIFFWYRISSVQLSNLKDYNRYEVLKKYLEKNSFQFKSKYHKILFITQINRLAKRICGINTLYETSLMIIISPSWLSAVFLKILKNFRLPSH